MILRTKTANTDLRKSEKTEILATEKTETEAAISPKTPENTVDSQGPTPVCTPTFLERRKSEVADLNDDDNDDEIVFKQPVSEVKEAAQASQTPTHSKKRKRRKSSQ